jgi:hypothetical protein
MFLTGSDNETEICVQVTVHTDNVVEHEEYFSVILTLVTTGASLKTTNDTSTVIIVDSDGMLILRI